MSTDVQIPLLTTDELCRACAVHTEYVAELVHEGVITPAEGSTPETWRFISLHAHSAQVAQRLQRDLGINLPGVALALQLMQELENLRAQTVTMEETTVVDLT